MPGNPNISVPSNNQNVDVVFVHDATGSLQPYIDDARQFVNNKIRDIQNRAIMNGGDARYRVIAFRDHREQGDLWTVNDSNPFTKDFTVLKRQLDAVVTSGGGDGPEAQIVALDAALRSSWRRDAKRIVILITDSPPHGIGEPGDVVPASHPGALTPDSIRQNFKTTKTLLTVVGCNPTINQYKRAVEWYTNFATETKGEYIPLRRPAGGSAVKDRVDNIVGTTLQPIIPFSLSSPQGQWVGDLVYPSGPPGVGLTVSFEPFIIGKTTNGSGLDNNGEFSIQSAQFTYLSTADYVGIVTFLQIYSRWPGQLWYFVGTVRKDNNRIPGEWHDSPQDGRARTGKFNLEGASQSVRLPAPMTLPSIALPSLAGEWSGDLVYPSGPPGVGLTVSFEPFITGSTTNGRGSDKNGEFSIQSAQFTYLSTADHVGVVTFLQTYTRWPGQVWCFIGTVHKDNNRISGEWHDSPQDGRARTGKFSLKRR